MFMLFVRMRLVILSIKYYYYYYYYICIMASLMATTNQWNLLIYCFIATS